MALLYNPVNDSYESITENGFKVVLNANRCMIMYDLIIIKTLEISEPAESYYDRELIFSDDKEEVFRVILSEDHEKDFQTVSNAIENYLKDVLSTKTIEVIKSIPLINLSKIELLMLVSDYLHTIADLKYENYSIKQKINEMV